MYTNFFLSCILNFFFPIYTINFLFFILVAIGRGIAQAPGLAGLTPEPALDLNHINPCVDSLCVL